MPAKSIISTVTGFLTKHVTDLNNLADAFSGILAGLPIDSQDKERIGSTITEIKTSADNISNFLETNKVSGGDVTVKESDIVDALANFFASDAGKAALKASTEGNASA